jgi:hypothetical protein
MKNDVFWDVTPCGSCKNRRFGGTYRRLHQDDNIGELGTTLVVTSNRNIPEDAILQDGVDIRGSTRIPAGILI